MKSPPRAWFRKYHKWPSLVLSLFIILFAVSGVVLNHRGLFSSIDVSRNYLPANYRYQNWNLAAVKGAVPVGHDSILVFGNLGIWLADSAMQEFTDYNQGFPAGVDQRKVSTLLKTTTGDLFAGTLFGLYFRGKADRVWRKLSLPIQEERIVKVLMVKGKLWVMSRSYLLEGHPQGLNTSLVLIPVPAAADDDNKTGLFKTLWVIHSGEIYGQIGRYFVDFVAFIFVFLTLTGLAHFFTPFLLKRAGEKAKGVYRKIFKFNLKWHNLSGSWLIVVLLLTTLTGIFLRPPLLIPIASNRVGKIPYSVLDDPNPWHDKFRDILFDSTTHQLLLATTDNIYFINALAPSLSRPLAPSSTPPLSVMGITVFQQTRPGEYLVGSFSGLFRWIPSQNYIQDYLTKEVKTADQDGGKPFGDVAVSGYIGQGEREIVFDYAKGAMVFTKEDAPAAMPGQILEESPMSLWNLCLEIHTCRIYEPLIGLFYVLLIPLFGLGIMFVLITGFFSWYLGRKEKSLTRS